MTAAEIQDRIRRGKEEILDLIGWGVIPANVATFSALHDSIDANTLAGCCSIDGPFRGEHDDAVVDEHWRAVCRIQDALDEWLRAGRPIDF